MTRTYSVTCTILQRNCYYRITSMSQVGQYALNNSLSIPRPFLSSGDRKEKAHLVTEKRKGARGGGRVVAPQ
jgi:hypothetical protein